MKASSGSVGGAGVGRGGHAATAVEPVVAVGRAGRRRRSRGPPQNRAWVRFGNLSPDAPRLDVCVSPEGAGTWGSPLLGGNCRDGGLGVSLDEQGDVHRRRLAGLPRRRRRRRLLHARSGRTSPRSSWTSTARTPSPRWVCSPPARAGPTGCSSTSSTRRRQPRARRGSASSTPFPTHRRSGTEWWTAGCGASSSPRRRCPFARPPPERASSTATRTSIRTRPCHSPSAPRGPRSRRTCTPRPSTSGPVSSPASGPSVWWAGRETSGSATSSATRPRPPTAERPTCQRR